MAVKKREHVFDPELIEAMYDQGNNDGFGLAYVEGERNDKGNLIKPGRIKVVKSMSGATELKEIFKQHTDKNLIMHLRNATLGEKNIENCHPYVVLDIDAGDKMDLVMMHNGTIRDVQIDKKMSDSWNFATHILGPHLRKHPNELFEPTFRYMLCTMLGTNKLVFLDNRERVLVVNYDLGSIHEPSGVWLSNKQELKVRRPINHPNLGIPPRHSQLGGGDDREDTRLTVIQGGTTTTWKDVRGQWLLDVDGRSHFKAEVSSVKAKKEKKKKDSKSIDTIDKLETWPPDDGQLQDLIKVAKLSPEDLREYEQEFQELSQHDIFHFVNECPVESAYTLVKVAKEKNLFPEFTTCPIKDVIIRAYDEPWTITHAILHVFRNATKEDKVVEVN